MFSRSDRVQQLQSLIENDGHNQEAHFLLGEEYLREGRFMAAAAKFRRVVELNPDHVRAWGRMAEAYAKVGNEKEAKTAQATAEFKSRELAAAGR